MELVAAARLLLAVVAPLAGAGLVLQLVVMFLANVKAALENLPLRNKLLAEPATPVAFRLPMQILFISVTWWASQRMLLLPE
jgi:uncharacterized membrane protein